MKNKRCNHSAQFKVTVAPAVAKGDKTMAELASNFALEKSFQRSFIFLQTIMNAEVILPRPLQPHQQLL